MRTSFLTALSKSINKPLSNQQTPCYAKPTSKAAACRSRRSPCRSRQSPCRSRRSPSQFANDFTTVHAREARVVCVGNESLSVPTEWLTLCEADEAWNSAPSWLPIDDPQYALDPDGDWYDEVVEGDVMENFGVHPTDSQPTTAKGKKQVRSGVSVR